MFLYRMVDLPLKDRIYKSSNAKSVLVTDPYAKNRPSSYKNWGESSIRAACVAVREGKLSQRRAAEEFGIPRSTLGDHYNGDILPGAKNGKSKYLTDSEETELVRFLLRCSSIGFPRSRQCVLSIVQRICNSKGQSVNVTHGWWEGSQNVTLI